MGVVANAKTYMYLSADEKCDAAPSSVNELTWEDTDCKMIGDYSVAGITKQYYKPLNATDGCNTLVQYSDSNCSVEAPSSRWLNGSACQDFLVGTDGKTIEYYKIQCTADDANGLKPVLAFLLAFAGAAYTRRMYA